MGFFSVCFGLVDLGQRHRVWRWRYSIRKKSKGCVKRSKKNFEVCERFEKIMGLQKFLTSNFCKIVNKWVFLMLFSSPCKSGWNDKIRLNSGEIPKNIFSKLWKTTRDCFWWTMTTLIHSFKSCKGTKYNFFVLSKFLWIYYEQTHLWTMSTWH